jgi:hypothetical protein
MRRAIQAIPTMYRGVMMRSRLEARWAATFDALGWPWVYEPADLEWYVPDFALTFEPAPIAVEIKPDLELADLRTYARRMVGAGWNAELLVLGSRMHADDIIGIHGELGTGPDVELGEAKVFRCISCGLVSLLNDGGGWRCRVSGCYGGNAHVGSLEPGELEAIWAAAGNRVQWRGALASKPSRELDR